METAHLEGVYFLNVFNVGAQNAYVRYYTSDRTLDGILLIVEPDTYLGVITEIKGYLEAPADCYVVAEQMRPKYCKPSVEIFQKTAAPADIYDFIDKPRFVKATTNTEFANRVRAMLLNPDLTFDSTGDSLLYMSDWNKLTELDPSPITDVQLDAYVSNSNTALNGVDGFFLYVRGGDDVASSKAICVSFSWRPAVRDEMNLFRIDQGNRAQIAVQKANTGKPYAQNNEQVHLMLNIKGTDVNARVRYGTQDYSLYFDASNTPELLASGTIGIGHFSSFQTKTIHSLVAQRL